MIASFVILLKTKNFFLWSIIWINLINRFQHSYWTVKQLSISIETLKQGLSKAFKPLVRINYRMWKAPKFLPVSFTSQSFPCFPKWPGQTPKERRGGVDNTPGVEQIWGKKEKTGALQSYWILLYDLITDWMCICSFITGMLSKSLSFMNICAAIKTQTRTKQVDWISHSIHPHSWQRSKIKSKA